MTLLACINVEIPDLDLSQVTGRAETGGHNTGGSGTGGQGSGGNPFSGGVIIESSGGCGYPGCSGGIIEGWTGGLIACFGPGTPIATPSGERPIEALRVGDEVWAYDHGRGQPVARRVSAVHHHPPAPVGRLRTEDGRELQVTSEHPVFDAALGRYVPAEELTAASTMLSFSEAHVPVAVRGFVESVGQAPLFNLTVEGEHNYFAAGLLVHNKSAPCTSGYWPSSCGPCPAQWNGTVCTRDEEQDICRIVGEACSHPVIGGGPQCPNLAADALDDAEYLSRLQDYLGLSDTELQRLAAASSPGTRHVELFSLMATPEGVEHFTRVILSWLGAGAGADLDDATAEQHARTRIGLVVQPDMTAPLGQLFGYDHTEAALGVRHGQQLQPLSASVAMEATSGIGVLTEALWLAALPTPSDRGQALAFALSCEDFPSHVPPMPPPSVTTTTYDAYASLALLPLCETCHKRVDGLGLALSAFDAQGLLTSSADPDAHRPLGSVYDEPVAGVGALAHALVEGASPDCLSRSLLARALARPMTAFDDCSIQWVQEALAYRYGHDQPTHFDLLGAILAVATSPAFHAR